MRAPIRHRKHQVWWRLLRRHSLSPNGCAPAGYGIALFERAIRMLLKLDVIVPEDDYRVYVALVEAGIRADIAYDIRHEWDDIRRKVIERSGIDGYSAAAFDRYVFHGKYFDSGLRRLGYYIVNGRQDCLVANRLKTIVEFLEEMED